MTQFRWVKSRKYKLIEAIRCNDLTSLEAQEKYGVSLEEIKSWMRLFDAHGVEGLRATKIQMYREKNHENARLATSL